MSSLGDEVLAATAALRDTTAAEIVGPDDLEEYGFFNACLVKKIIDTMAVREQQA